MSSLTAEEIEFEDDALRRVISNYTKEEGVRCLRRCIHQICSEVNLKRLMADADGDASVKREPTKITTDVVDSYVKSMRVATDAPCQMYM